MEEKVNQQNKISGFFHGIDPATKGDYYTDIIHVLPAKPKLTPLEPGVKFKWIPFIVGMMRLSKMDPDDMIDAQIKLFNKFPPTIAKIDSSREDFLSNALVKKYGESTIIPVKFLNAGASNTKFHLKQIGYSYINAGYEWPNIRILEESGYPRHAKLLKILKKEMMHEMVQYTNNNRITFNHPTGKHNDMVHAWELSLDAVMEFQQKNLGYEKMKNQPIPYATTNQDTYKDYPTEEIVPYDQSMPNSAFSLPY